MQRQHSAGDRQNESYNRRKIYKMNYFIEISKETNAYCGLIHQGNRRMAHAIDKMQLAPESTIKIKDQAYKLGNLIQAMLSYKKEDLAIAFDERGQLEIGRYLTQQLFQGMSPDELKTNPNERIYLRIVTEDEHIARLPWVLLNHRGIFLSANKWSISISSRSDVAECDFPENPRILIIAPEPSEMPKTRAEFHLDNLEYKLALFNPRLSRGDLIQVVKNWEDFRAKLTEFNPHIVYYYGHGVGDQYSTKIVFAKANNNKMLPKSVADFAQCLRELEEAPKIVYLNCCSGDAGGFLGAGWQLGEFVPAVITNRTVSFIDAAQSQAVAFWASVLNEGKAPHVSVTEIRGKLIDMELSFSDARWMTPVLHCHYSNWNSKPPVRIDPLEHDPHWHLKIDRVSQYGTVATLTRQMLRERKPHSYAFIWYGREGEGVDIFHRRLRVEFQADIATSAHFLEVRPDWPMEFSQPDRSFSDMLCEAFDVQSLEDIPRCIRTKTRGETGRQILVYVCHQPVTSPNMFDPKHLKDYLKWWDEKFMPLMQPNTYCLLTVSFVVQNPPKFQKVILDKEGFYELVLLNTVFRLLDEMEKVGKKDLLDFLQTHNIRLPKGRKDKIIQEILERTGGKYEMTVSALRKIVQRKWDEVEVKPNEKDDTSLDYDY